MWILVFQWLGVLGLIEIAITLRFWRQLEGTVAMDWLGPGTLLARLSVLFLLLGMIGMLSFFVQLAAGRREQHSAKAAAAWLFIAMFAVVCYLGMGV